MVSFYNRVVPSSRSAHSLTGAAIRNLVLEVTEKDAAIAISVRPTEGDEERVCLLSPEEGEILISALEKALQLARIKRDAIPRA
jgi:hypothetical protein